MKNLTIRSFLCHQRTLVASLMLILAVTLFSGTASAGTVTFNFSYACDIDNDTCNQTLYIGGLHSPAGDSLDLGNMATVNSDVVGHTTPVAISAGFLDFTSANATRDFFDPPHDYQTWYDLSGGSGSLTGSVFSVNGPLLTITSFLPGGMGESDYPLVVDFQGPFKGYLNPSLLTALGLPAGSGYGYGTIFDQENGFNVITNYNVTITFTPSPEPGTLAMFGSGFLGLGGLLRRRFGAVSQLRRRPSL